MSARLGVAHLWFTSTGRAGLTLLLRALRRTAPAGRDEVVIPTYTCYSVAASVVKAGLRPRLVDVDPDTLDFALDALDATDFSRVLGIVATNLYGFPSDLPALTALAARHGVLLIDDAAQALGASIGGRPCGTWGDAGLFSLDKGKNVSAIDGGVIVTNSGPVASVLADELSGLPGPGMAASAIHVLKALAYCVLLRPAVYGIPARIPQLGLGQTVFTTDFPLHRADPRLVALARVMVSRLDEFTQARTERASMLLEALRGVPGVATIAPRAGTRPAFLRLPVLVDAAERQGMIDSLTAAGIGATASYPASLADVPALAPHLANPGVRASGGRSIARRIVTLPTHPFVTSADISRMTTTLGRGKATACAA